MIKISEDEIITHPSLSDCSISPRSGNSRFRVCARRVPCGPFVVNKLPLLFPIDLNDGQCDVNVNSRLGVRVSKKSFPRETAHTDARILLLRF